MALHLVGETIAAKPAHAGAQKGELVQLVRGIYVDRTDSPDAVVLRHAVRIAHYLYPRAYLSSVSSVRLGPMKDGRLFLAGRRNQRTRLRALEIIQNEAPSHPSTATAIVADELGELRVAVSSPRQRFLEAFRLRSEHAAAIDPELRDQFAERLLAEYGSPKAAADALWQLARENQWYREGERAERYLLSIELLLRRAIFAWLTADGDMHLKNLALLKLARLGSRTFTSVRLAPLYDAVSTRVFPKLASDRMALKLNGKDDRLTRADFRAVATTMGVHVSRADAACDELADRLAVHAPKLRLPAFARREASRMRDAFVAIVEMRAKALR